MITSTTVIATGGTSCAATTARQDFTTTKNVHKNTTKIQIKKATLGMGDPLYQCQPTNSIISTLTFISADSYFRLNNSSAAYSAPWSCECTLYTNLRIYTYFSVFIKRYQFQQQTRCFPRRLSIPHPLILFGQVLNNYKVITMIK